MSENAKKKIMIVEDDSFVRDIYQTKLSREGFEVIESINGVEALKKLTAEKPDIILLDVVLPYMNGLEILRKIKQDEKLKDIPVILLTNLSQKEDVSAGMELGAADYLIKSHFTPSDVLEKIKTYIQ